MDGRFRSDSPETSSPSPRSGELKAVHQFSSTSFSSPKRSRRSVQKKVVTVPISEADGSRPRITGEGAPPSDSWAWRKYGQKPIKGSPYPRGYYRCSSSKGCPARKQVERSSSDPTMLVVTYSCEHNHSWPLPKSHHHRSTAVILNTSIPSPVSNEEEPEAVMVVPVSEPAEDKFLIGEELMRDEYYWFSDVGSPSATSTAGSTDDLLLGSIVVSADIAAMSFSAECEELGRWEEEEDSLFAGLGELPEFSVVLRRGFVDGRRCGLAASL